MRTQNTLNEGLLAAKLSLAAHVESLTAELEDSKRSLERARAKQFKSTEDEDELEAELTALRRQVASSKGGDKAETKELRNEVKRLEKELSTEQRERKKAEAHAAKIGGQKDAEKAVLDDKLDQFRTKLRSTRDKLKETEEQLELAQNPAVQPVHPNPRKRSAAQAHLDPDAALGTPGDAMKRSKRVSSAVVGEKSNFSITPFLNRHTSVDPDNDANVPLPSIEVASPVPERAKQAPQMSPNVLRDAPSNKINKKFGIAATRKKAAMPSRLELVGEENTSPVAAAQITIPDEYNTEIVTATSNLAQARPKTTKPLLKPKSLSSFPSFREASLPSVQAQMKKKRKLVGGPGKTLFDEDEEEPVTKAGQRAFGGFGTRPVREMGILGKKRGPIDLRAAGFIFSPLRREKAV